MTGAELSLPKQARRLEKYIYTLPAARKLNMLDRVAREAMINLRDSVTAARGALELYNGSDDTAEQTQALRESIKQLKLTNEAILRSSQYNLLDTTDVAHLSALTEQIIEQLK